jgi:Helix-turn-helix domain
MLYTKSDDVGRSSTINRDQLLTIGDLMNFRTALINDIRSLLQESPIQPSKQWLKSAEVRKMLSISPGTLQNLRVNGTLTFTKIGGIVFYRYDDVEKMLKDNSSK